MINDDRIRKIIEISQKYNLKPAFMARLIGISLPTYYRYIGGKTTPKTQSIIRAIDSVIQQYGGGEK